MMVLKPVCDKCGCCGCSHDLRAVDVDGAGIDLCEPCFLKRQERIEEIQCDLKMRWHLRHLG